MRMCKPTLSGKEVTRSNPITGINIMVVLLKKDNCNGFLYPKIFLSSYSLNKITMSPICIFLWLYKMNNTKSLWRFKDSLCNRYHYVFLNVRWKVKFSNKSLRVHCSCPSVQMLNISITTLWVAELKDLLIYFSLLLCTLP